MKKILVIGNSPLPEENTKSRPAAGLRTWQFIKPLLERDDVQLKLVSIAMPECYEEEPKFQEITHGPKYSQTIISKNDPALLKKVQEVADEFKADLILGVNTYPSYVAAQINSELPFWADLNGWIMAEAQAHAHKMDSNDFFFHYYGMQKKILEEADKISVVSEAQGFAILGELASLGRLNKESFGYNFIEHIPNGAEWFKGEKSARKGKKELFGELPRGSFVALWLGGYNNWVDEETLFEGLVKAMKQCPKMYFVSTGGEIKGLAGRGFRRFKEMIERSVYKERFIFLGWVETEDIPSIYMKADCGLNVDKKCSETLTGARNRINEMMKFGLPVVTTLGSEISYEVARVGAGMGVRSGDAEGLAKALKQMYEGWERRNDIRFREFERFAEAGRKYVEESCNYAAVGRPFLKWMLAPEAAPDRGVVLSSGWSAKLRAGWRYLRENGVKQFWRKLLQKISSRF